MLRIPLQFMGCAAGQRYRVALLGGVIVRATLPSGVTEGGGALPKPWPCVNPIPIYPQLIKFVPKCGGLTSIQTHLNSTTVLYPCA
mgnify:CR=1 FL=1